MAFTLDSAGREAHADPFKWVAPLAASEAPLAPYPVNDRYPLVLGSNVTLQYVSAAMRTATQGYRREYVDLLNELIERDPHTQCVVSQSIATVSGGRVEVSPCESTETDAPKAAEACEIVTRAFAGIVDLRGSIASLAWADFHGVSGLETSWQRDGGWMPRRLHFIHSRRISYPDPSSWDARIWDQGQVRSFDSGSKTGQMFGINPNDYPGKFIIHASRVRGDYPTRDGLGRVLALYMALKTMGMRGLANTAERFGKPWVFAYYSTGEKPRTASNDDISKADMALRALGIGGLAAAALPDSIKIQVERISGGKASKNAFLELIETCNSEISKAVLTQTLTTEVGHSGGNRALGGVMERGALRVAQSKASSIGETLRWQLAEPILRFNRADLLRFLPVVNIHVEDEPGAIEMIDRGVKMAAAGAPVDADALAAKAGVKLLEGITGRRLTPVSPTGLAQLEALNRGEVLEHEAPEPAPLPSETDEDDAEEGESEDAPEAAEEGAEDDDTEDGEKPPTPH